MAYATVPFAWFWTVRQDLEAAEKKLAIMEINSKLDVMFIKVHKLHAEVAEEKLAEAEAKIAELEATPSRKRKAQEAPTAPTAPPRRSPRLH
jgi:uncharacterized membrane protein YukC